MSNNKVLITGGCGFIGGHLCKKLVEMGKDVTVLDINAPRNNNASGYKVIRGDICNRKLVGGLMKGVDTVYHLAAVTTFHECRDDPRKAFRVNVRGTAILLREALRCNVSNFVFFSSASVYSGNKESVKHEEMKLEPQSVYGMTKMQGEELCSCATKFGLPCASLRLFNVYGEGGRGVINRFTDAARGDRHIVIRKDGRQTRDYIHVSDVVRAAIAAEEGRLSGACNVGAGEGHSLLMLAKMVEHINDTTFDVEWQPREPWDLQELVADTGKIREILPTTTPLEEGLRALLRECKAKCQ